MCRELIVDLDRATPFRQTLAARPPWITHFLVLLLSTLLIAFVAWAATTEAKLVIRSEGRVRSIERPARVFSTVSNRLDNRVKEVFYDEGSRVKAGEVLVRLQTATLDNEIAALERQVETMRNELVDLDARTRLIQRQKAVEIQKSRAEVLAASSEIEIAKARRKAKLASASIARDAAAETLRRAERLFQQSAASQSELDTARQESEMAIQQYAEAEVRVDTSRLAVLEQAVKLVEEEFAIRIAQVESQIISKEGQLGSATKKLDNLLLQRQQCELRSPIDGIVVSAAVQTGDAIEAGRPVVEIARGDDFQFETIVPSKDAGDLKVGMPVRIKFSAYDYQKYGTLSGTVRFVSPDTKASGPADSGLVASRNAGPVTSSGYLVRVELADHTLRQDDRSADIKLGLEGVAEIIAGEERLLTIFAKKLRQGIRLD